MMTNDDKKLLTDIGSGDIYNGREFFMPFSPIIMQSTVPQKFIDIINRVGDDVLNDDKKSVQWDWSHNLVGKVHKEIQNPFLLLIVNLFYLVFLSLFMVYFDIL